MATGRTRAHLDRRARLGLSTGQRCPLFGRNRERHRLGPQVVGHGPGGQRPMLLARDPASGLGVAAASGDPPGGTRPATTGVTVPCADRSIGMARVLVVLVVSVLLSGCGDDGVGGAEPSHEQVGTIEPNKSIGGVRLGMAQAEVRALLGEPDTVEASELHGGWTLWVYSDRRLRVTFEERVWDVRTTHPGDRTADGVGVGSAEREVRRAMPVVNCGPYGGPARYRDWRICVDTRGRRGPFTQFTLIRGRVTLVTVAQGLAL